MESLDQLEHIATARGRQFEPMRRGDHSELFLQAEVERLEQLVDAEAARGDYILEAAQDNIDGFAQALDQQAQRHQRSRQAELQHQRQGLTRAAAQELVQERRQRMTALKEVTCRPCACWRVCCCGVGGQRRGERWGMALITSVKERWQGMAALKGASASLKLAVMCHFWGGEKEGGGQGRGKVVHEVIAGVLPNSDCHLGGSCKPYTPSEVSYGGGGGLLSSCKCRGKNTEQLLLMGQVGTLLHAVWHLALLRGGMFHCTSMELRHKPIVSNKRRDSISSFGLSSCQQRFIAPSAVFAFNMNSVSAFANHDLK